ARDTPRPKEMLEMQKLRFILAATAASLLIASAAFACGDKTTTQASGHPGCAMKAGKACCAHGAATQTTMATVGTNVDVTTCTYKPGDVAFRGTVLCNHCDLHKSDTCQTMFRTDSGCLFAMSGDKASAL